MKKLLQDLLLFVESHSVVEKYGESTKCVGCGCPMHSSTAYAHKEGCSWLSLHNRLAKALLELNRR